MELETTETTAIAIAEGHNNEGASSTVIHAAIAKVSTSTCPDP